MNMNLFSLHLMTPM